MFIDTIYCGHCWLWLNDNLIDIDNKKYLGENIKWEDINLFLKKTIKLHTKSCQNINCIYNKIKNTDFFTNSIDKKECFIKNIKNIINNKNEFKINYKQSIIII
jgi:hypothetical protein